MPSPLVASPSEAASPRLRWAAAGLLVGLWTIPGLLCAAQIYAEAVVQHGEDISVAAILWYALPVWWAWIPLTVAVAALSRRVPLDAERRLRAWSVHAVACIATVALHIFLYAVWIDVAAPTAADDPRGPLAHFIGLLDDAWVHVDLFIYALIVGSVHAFDYYQESRRRELRESQLQAQLKNAQLDALRAQLRPHFLFNSLSAIQTLTLRNDDPQAAQMIARLSEFLRTTLNETTAQRIPLADELAFVDQYVAIEKCRFADRLTVETDVDPALRSAPVPTLVLQPLVENAIRHGIEPKDGPGTVSIRAWKDRDRLALRVADDGVGAADTNRRGEGLGNTEARLAQMYGDRFSLDVDAAPGDGFCVTLHLPLKAARLDAAPESSTSSDGAPHGDGIASADVRLS